MRKASRILMGSLVGICGVMLASCGSDSLSKGSAEGALEDQLVMFQDSSQVVRLNTGYYELDDADARFQLKKLAAAGVIDYKVDLIVETRTGWYAGQYEHYFVTVNLTEEGKKYVVSKPVTEIVDKDMEVKESDESYPEDNVAPGDDLSNTGSAAQSNLETPADGDVMDPDTYPTATATADMSEYEAAQAKQHIDMCTFLSHKNKIVKIQRIFCPEEMMKNGKASCEYIYEYSDVTPFGRILNGVKEGSRQKESATFVRYEDLGWTLQD